MVDKDGLPTRDPSHYPEEGAVLPMPAYGCEIEEPNNVCHTFIAIDIEQFAGKEAFVERADAMAAALRSAPKAKGVDRIYTPEMEWNNYQNAQDGL